MGSNGKACAECTQICQLMHGKKGGDHPSSSAMVTSFFKVMIGDDISEILFLPPKFARTVSALVGPKTYLEDSNGRRWEVTVSLVNGYFAFQQGWRDFSLDHGLEIGDILIFYYITGSHFFVQIYGKSGCPKLDFSGNNDRQKKRTRTNKGSVDKQGSSNSAVSKSRNVNDVGEVPLAMGKASYFVNGSGMRIPRSEFDEETHYIIDRDIPHTEQEYRSSLFDLSIFEMPRVNIGGDGNNKVLGEKETSVRSQTEAVLVHKDPVCEAAGSLVAPSGAPRFAAFEKNKNSQVRDKLMLKSGKDSRTAVKLAKNRNVSVGPVGTPNVVIKECDNAERRNTDLSRTLERMNAVKKEQVEMIEELRHGKKPKIINECSQSIGLAVRDDVKVCAVMKTEPVDSIDYSSADAVNVSLSVVVPDGQTFLELPTCLPSITKGRMRTKVVVLRDPVSRLWPLLYQDKYGFKTLTSCWKAFCEANNIQPGDTCVFELENLPECIYKVGIVRK